MTTITGIAVADWLDENIGSHDVYDTRVFEADLECTCDGLPKGVLYDAETDSLKIDIANLPVEDMDLLAIAKPQGIRLGTRSPEVMRVREGAVETQNPKGVYLEDDIDPALRLFGGHELSRVFDRLLTGENAGGRYMGRGSAHRASIRHLRGEQA